MRRTLTAVALAALVSLPATIQAADWPQFRGVNADGISTEAPVNTDWAAKAPAVLWELPLTDKGYAGPAVVGGKLYIVDHQGNQDIVRAVNAADGKELWNYSYTDSAKYDYGYTRATPLISGDKLYVMSYLGKLVCLKVADGQPIWTRDLAKDYVDAVPAPWWPKNWWGYSMSLALDGDKLVTVPGGDGATVVTINKNTGETIWKGGGKEKPGYSTPVVATLDGKKQYIVMGSTTVFGVDAETGARLWEYPWKTQFDINCAMPIVVDANRVFLTSGYGHGCALLEVKDNTPTVVWENKTIKSRMNTPIYAGGFIYSGSEPNKLICLNPTTGETKWETPGIGNGGSAVAGGALISVDEKTGDVVLSKLAPDAYQELGRVKVMPGARDYWTPAVVADGKLFVRSTLKLVCLDLKP